MINALLYSLTGTSSGYADKNLNTLVPVPAQSRTVDRLRTLLSLIPENDFIWKGIICAVEMFPYTATECRGLQTYDRREWRRKETVFSGDWGEMRRVGEDYPSLCPSLLGWTPSLSGLVTTWVSLDSWRNIVLQQGDHAETVPDTSKDNLILLPAEWPVWMNAKGAIQLKQDSFAKGAIQSWPSFPYSVLVDFLGKNQPVVNFLEEAGLLSAYYEEEDPLRKTALLGLAFYRLLTKSHG